MVSYFTSIINALSHACERGIAYGTYLIGKVMYHLFFACPYTLILREYRIMSKKCNLYWSSSCLAAMVLQVVLGHKGNSLPSIICTVMLSCAFYHIWKKRNSRTSINEQKPAHTMSYIYLLCGSNRTMLKECRKMIRTDGCREPGNSHVLSLMLIQCILLFVLMIPKPKSTYISSIVYISTMYKCTKAGK